MSLKVKILLISAISLFISSISVLYLSKHFEEQRLDQLEMDIRTIGDHTILQALEQVATKANGLLLSHIEDEGLISAFENKNWATISLTADGILRPIGDHYKYWIFGELNGNITTGVPELAFENGTPAVVTSHLQSSCLRELIRKKEEAGRCFQINDQEVIYWIYQPFYNDDGDVIGFSEIGIDVTTSLINAAKVLMGDIAILNLSGNISSSTNEKLFNKININNNFKKSSQTHLVNIEDKTFQVRISLLLSFDEQKEIIGHNIVVLDVTEKAKLETKNNRITLLITAGTVLFFAFILLLLIGRSLKSIIGPIATCSNQLKSIVESLGTQANKNKDIGDELSDSVSTQASSLEETSESMAVIKNEAGNNVEHANEMALQSNKVTELTESAINAEKELIKLMSDISKNGEEIGTLASVIEEVGERTEIINDIVFQTKLLSFNASVEAERAGEHGRGFSVVAQEVGNLAKMSGNAANDISDIIKKSLHLSTKVSGENAKLITLVTSKMNEVDKTLINVAEIIKDINKRSSGILQGSKEQQSGVNNISIGMNQINSSVQSNSGAAQSLSNSTEEVITLVHDLGDVSKTLLKLIVKK